MSIIVNADNFVRAESDLMFSRILAAAGAVNRWHHFRELSPIDQQPIVRQNRDTLYSAAIVDLADPVTLVVPASAERYLSVMVVNQDHYIPAIFHEPGEYVLTEADLGSRYVMLGSRILVDPADPADIAEVNNLQDGLGLLATSSTEFVLPDYDTESMATTRNALIALSDGLPDFTGSFGRADEVSPVRHLIGAASGWGGLPDYEAHYLNVVPGLPVGEYQLRIVDPPVDAFWSISLYNAEGYFEANELGVNNINSVTAAQDEDGAITIRLGVAPDGHPNYLPIMDGWNYMIRLYRPRPEVLDGTWQPGAVLAIEDHAR
jgi:hypothetical protein